MFPETGSVSDFFPNITDKSVNQKETSLLLKSSLYANSWAR